MTRLLQAGAKRVEIIDLGCPNGIKHTAIGSGGPASDQYPDLGGEEPAQIREFRLNLRIVQWIDKAEGDYAGAILYGRASNLRGRAPTRALGRPGMTFDPAAWTSRSSMISQVGRENYREMVDHQESKHRRCPACGEWVIPELHPTVYGYACACGESWEEPVQSLGQHRD